MSSDITDNILEQYVCQALSLTGISIEPDNLQACHCLKKDQAVINLNVDSKASCSTNKSFELTQIFRKVIHN